MMVPITSPHRRNALKVMDYYYEPAVTAQVAAWVNYVCPVEGAREEMEKIDPELAKSPFIFPDAAYLRDNNIQIFRALSPEEEAEYSEAWAKVVGN
jgi:spermidine/putrescine transport system substrate-binding protein